MSRKRKRKLNSKTVRSSSSRGETVRSSKRADSSDPSVTTKRGKPSGSSAGLWRRALKKALKHNGSTSATRSIAPSSPRTRLDPDVVAKTPSKKSKTSSTNSKSGSKFRAAFDDWKGGTPLFELVTKYGEKRPKLRRELTILAGGKAEFQKLRQKGAGGSRALFGGKQHVRSKASVEASAALDDSKVPQVKSMKKSRGWTFREIFTGPGKQNQVFIAKSPKTGREYVKCSANEKADLIHLGDSAWHMPPIRMKLFVESKLAKKMARTEKQDEQRADQGFERRIAKKQAGDVIGKKAGRTLKKLTDDTAYFIEPTVVAKKRVKKIRRHR